MRVLLAFDKFKGSLTAEEACAAAAGAIREKKPEWSVDECPITDGGDGFARILTAAAGGEWTKVTVSGPRGDPVSAGFGLVASEKIPREARLRLGYGEATTAAGRPATCAVVDMASASGLELLDDASRDPWCTSSRGTGELIAAAIAAGAGEILLGIGGSATNDLGVGALAALGLEPRDDHGVAVDPPVPRNWPRIARFTWSEGPFGQTQGRSALKPIGIACDVKNPLLGSNGAAATYGPQKGLTRGDVRKMDHEAARIALMLCHQFNQPESTLDMPGAGAAGGMGFGLSVAGIGRLIAGFDLVAEWLGLAGRIDRADLVVTGEGAFDASSFSGKATGSVIDRALAAGKRVHVFAGQVNHASPPSNVVVRSINPSAEATAAALPLAAPRLAQAITSFLVSM